MKDNRTKQICNICNSHIITYREKGKIIYECTYCGEVPEDIHLIDLEEQEDE